MSYDQPFGVWIGLNLRLTCRMLNRLAMWASMNTFAGRRFMERVVRRYKRRPVRHILSDLCGGGRLWTLFGHVDNIDLFEVAKATASSDDAPLLRALYGGVVAIPQQYKRALVSEAVRHSSIHVVDILIGRSAHLFSVAVYEAVCLGASSALIDELRRVATLYHRDNQQHLDDDGLPLRLLDCEDVSTFDFTDLVDCFHSFVITVVRCDNGAILKRLVECGMELHWYEDKSLLKPNCVAIIANHIEPGIEWLAHHDRSATSLRWLTGPQVIQFMDCQQPPVRRHVYVSAAVNADLEVFRWVTRHDDGGQFDSTPNGRLGIMLVELMMSLHENHVPIDAALGIFSEFSNFLTERHWQNIVLSCIERGDAAFTSVITRFKHDVMKIDWKQLTPLTLLRSHLAMAWAADNELLDDKQCMMLVARHVDPLPLPIMQRIHGKSLRVSSLKVALEMGHCENARYLLQHTRHNTNALIAECNTLISMALMSHNVTCLKWVLDTFARRLTYQKRKKLLDGLIFKIPMTMEHLLLFG